MSPAIGGNAMGITPDDAHVVWDNDAVAGIGTEQQPPEHDGGGAPNQAAPKHLVVLAVVGPCNDTCIGHNPLLHHHTMGEDPSLKDTNGGREGGE